MPLPFMMQTALFTLDPSGNSRSQIQQDLSRLPNVCRQIANAQRIYNRYEPQARTLAQQSALRTLKAKIDEAIGKLADLQEGIGSLLWQAHSAGWITAQERDGLTAQPQSLDGPGVSGYSATVPVIVLSAAAAVVVAGVLLVATAPLWAPLAGISAALAALCGGIIALLGFIVAIPAALNWILEGADASISKIFSPIVVTTPDGRPVVAPSPWQQASATLSDTLKEPVVLIAAAVAGLLIFGAFSARR